MQDPLGSGNPGLPDLVSKMWKMTPNVFQANSGLSGEVRWKVDLLGRFLGGPNDTSSRDAWCLEATSTVPENSFHSFRFRFFANIWCFLFNVFQCCFGNYMKLWGLSGFMPQVEILPGSKLSGFSILTRICETNSKGTWKWMVGIL